MKEITNHERLRLLGILSIVLDAYENAIFTLSTDTCTVLYAKAFLYNRGLNRGICFYINYLFFENISSEMEVAYIRDNMIKPILRKRSYSVYYGSIPDRCRTTKSILRSLENQKELINNLISSLKNQ